jgi:hypothetical protein
MLDDWMTERERERERERVIMVEYELKAILSSLLFAG